MKYRGEAQKNKGHMARTALCAASLAAGLFLSSCADFRVADPRSVNIPAPTPPHEREKGVNETPDSVLSVPLGRDVLVPRIAASDPLPSRQVGPYELRNENLAGALQLILADDDVPLAFETDLGLSRKITVSNLKGPLNKVVDKVCAIADLYCQYDDGVLTIKENQTFTLSLPPLSGEDAYEGISAGLEAITGETPIIDKTTRTMIYSASERTSGRAKAFFERLRQNTALIVYETYIWEVELSGGNSAGIRWTQLADLGNFNTGISVTGATDSELGTPISIGLPTKGAVNLTTGDILRFISSQGAVKTISQPQLTVLSGSDAELRVAETQNYIESLSRTTDDNGDETVSTTTGKVDSGFTLKIGSSWDDATVYGNVEIDLQEFLGFQEFDAGQNDTLQLPRTSERQLKTQIRARPGDSVLIAGLVRERHSYDKTGLGLATPVIPVERTGQTTNSELVFLLRPRVIVYKPEAEYEAEQAAKAALGEPETVQKSPVGKVDKTPLDEEEALPEQAAITRDEEREADAPYSPAKAKRAAAAAKAAAPVRTAQTSVTAYQPETQSDLPMGTLPSDLLNPSLTP